MLSYLTAVAAAIALAGAASASNTPNADIFAALANTNQTAGAPVWAPPAQEVAPVVAASNTSSVVATTAQRRAAERRGFNKGNVVAMRDLGGTVYNAISNPDSTAAVQMPAYLTYKVISNTTSLNVARDSCFDFCDATPGCLSVNIYEELGNPLLDHVFSEQSNRKCVLFGDVPTASQFTNRGGQQLYPTGPLNSIQDSVAFASSSDLFDVDTPDGSSLVFAPQEGDKTEYGATQTGDYLTYRFITRYDPAACLAFCQSVQGESYERS